MKASRNGAPSAASVPESVEHSVEMVDNIDPADDTSPPGFVGLLTATQSEALTPGWYSMDARIKIGEFAIQTDSSVFASPIV